MTVEWPPRESRKGRIDMTTERVASLEFNWKDGDGWTHHEDPPEGWERSFAAAGQFRAEVERLSDSVWCAEVRQGDVVIFDTIDDDVTPLSREAARTLCERVIRAEVQREAEYQVYAARETTKAT